MKLNNKFVLALAAAGLFSLSASAQKGAYFNLNLGFAGGLGSQTLLENSTETATSGTYEAVHVSFGKGMNVGGTFGYMFSDNVGADLGLSYLMGGKTTATDIYPGGKSETTYSSKMFRINPSIVVSSANEGIAPYAKFGVVIGMGSITEEYMDNDDGDVLKTTFKMDGGMALGMSGALGALVSMSDKISFFGELNMIGMSYAPTKGVYTEATYNGTSFLNDMTTSEREVEYVDSITINSTNPPESQPSKELKMNTPWSSIGANLGLRINF